MQHSISKSVELRRRCPGPCSTSYTITRCSVPRVERPWRTVTKANIYDMMDRQLADMERQFETMQKQIDRDIDAAMSRAREAERQADAEFQRAKSGNSQRSSFSQDMRPSPNVEIQRQEESAPGMYRYYERIQINSSGSYRGYISQPAAAATSVVKPVSPSLNPALVGALVVLGGYVTLTAAFNRNYALTNYAESKRWLLMALWPLLFLFSPKFREQFAAAIRGERVGLKREGTREGDSNAGSSE
ncbi:hypothetical protein VOLCADRAFT_105310 [Volvox carteri f. nagariensis]|uniref:Uncharacterized protein n=1 Tax=Volvox carteri f. nagariensis TaxID=3068 RepID=D8TZZ6_VOLCA|nr:uncharacterized protein VOLCADRAFT_105310 [Volvox carteri f. nagariensis]EFJ47020.1 hypothetical protein VOLCADRAFT_105310 [Volvox carteri f. nagariensis]|eukprot:XP_002951915.1 hypothetical protein VOLCADRAFT_105310 [Volvox carteri f. nagariensis]